MSQIGGKMSKFQGKFVIVSIDLRFILSNYVATDIYALFKKYIKKNLLRNVQNEGGGDQRLFEQCLKKLQIWYMRAPLINKIVVHFVQQVCRNPDFIDIFENYSPLCFVVAVGAVPFSSPVLPGLPPSPSAWRRVPSRSFPSSLTAAPLLAKISSGFKFFRESE